MNVDADDSRIGYLLGRLFAVIEHAQLRGGGGGEPACMRMMDIASKVPQRVFPDLLRLYYRCVRKLGESNEGAGLRLESNLDEIFLSMGKQSGIPNALSPEDQCLFFLGYRFQRLDLRKA